MKSDDFNSDDFYEYIISLDNLSKKFHNFKTTDNIDDIYRDLHSVKTITYYFDLEEISILIERVENIIMFVNNYECDKNCILDWFKMFSVQLNIWVQQLKHQEMPSFFDIFFEEMPLVKCKAYKSRLNKVVHIIVNQNKFTPALEELFKSSFKYVNVFASIYDIISAVEQSGSTKIITTTKFTDGTLTDLLTELNDLEYNLDNLYLLVEVDDKEKFKIIKQNINVKYIINANIVPLQKIAEHIQKKCECDVNLMKIPNNNISLVELTNKIQPLSKTINKLKEMCFGEAEIKEIVKVINKDPMFTAIILKTINTPFIGLPNRVSKVPIAVSLLGKKRVGSIVLSEMSRIINDHEPLTAYNISINDLLSIAQIRSRFVTEWMKYIDIPTEKKEDLSSLIHLLPIGMIICNQALVYNKAAKRFANSFDVSNPGILEKQLIGWSSYDALTKIFELWNMPLSLVKMSVNVANYGVKNNFKDLNIYAVIIILSTQIFRIDGTYNLEKSHLIFAQANKLIPEDMKNIYEKTVQNLPKNIFEMTDD
jgi:HD-like signal output (HDOD) protein